MGQDALSSRNAPIPDAPARGWFGRFWFESRVGAAAPFLVIALVGLGLRFWLYPTYHRNNDIPSYLFAAETFARGRLKVPVPEPDRSRTHETDPQFFRTWMVVPHNFNDTYVAADGSRRRYDFMYTRYTPGHPFFLMLGKMLTGGYALVPVLLMLLGAYGAYRAARLFAGETAARWTATLLMLSPFFLGYGASLLNHNTTFACLAWATFCYFAMDRAAGARGRIAWGCAAAGLYALALTCRPMTGAAFIVGVIVWEVLRLRRDRTHVASRWMAMALGGGIVLAGLLGYNAAVTGAPLRFAFSQYWPRDTLGFTGFWPQTDVDLETASLPELERVKHRFKGEEGLGARLLRCREHTPLHGVWNLAVVLTHFNRFFLLLPGGLVLAALLLAWEWRRLPPARTLLLAQIGLVALGYFFHFSHGTLHWGPRYYYACLLPLVLLVAPLIEPARAALRALPAWTDRSRWIVALLLLLSLAHTVGTLSPRVEHELWVQHRRQEVSDAVAREVTPPAVVFLYTPFADKWHYLGNHMGHLINSPTFDDPILYAVNNGAQNAVLMNHPRYRHRHFYEIVGPGRIRLLKRGRGEPAGGGASDE